VIGYIPKRQLLKNPAIKIKYKNGYFNFELTNKKLSVDKLATQV
jgi:hypothetical protein